MLTVGTRLKRNTHKKKNHLQNDLTRVPRSPVDFPVSTTQVAAVLLPFSLPGRNSGCPWTKRLPSSRPPTATSPSCRASVARARRGNTDDPAADGPNEIKQLNPFLSYAHGFKREHLVYVCGPRCPKIESRSSSTGRVLLIRIRIGRVRPRPRSIRRPIVRPPPRPTIAVGTGVGGKPGGPFRRDKTPKRDP